MRRRKMRVGGFFLFFIFIFQKRWEVAVVAAVAVAAGTRTGGWRDFVELETQVWLSSDFVENNAAVAGGG